MEDEVQAQPGWFGAFTRAQAEGAYPNGSRIVKTMREEGDAHDVGALGIVLGSLKLPEPIVVKGRTMQYGYFVEWDDRPRVAVFVTEVKIGPKL